MGGERFWGQEKDPRADTVEVTQHGGDLNRKPSKAWGEEETQEGLRRLGLTP